MYNFIRGVADAHDEAAQGRRVADARRSAVLRDLLDLQAGAIVGVSIDDGRLVVEPRPRRRYTLDELLAECDATAGPAHDEGSWLDAPPVGDELL